METIIIKLALIGIITSIFLLIIAIIALIINNNSDCESDIPLQYFISKFTSWIVIYFMIILFIYIASCIYNML